MKSVQAKPIRDWSELNKDAINNDKYKLNDRKKELLTMGYIRDETNNSLHFPFDIVTLLIKFMFLHYKKENIALAVIGHVDCGKSTLCGKFLYELGYISERKMKKYVQGQ